MTTMRKGRDGWQATDTVEFQGPYQLTIETHKMLDRMGLVTRASVSEHTEHGYTHRCGMGAGGDYSERFMQSSQRCTEKSVAAQHAQAMSRLAEIQERARAHYAKYPIKEAA